MSFVDRLLLSAYADDHIGRLAQKHNLPLTPTRRLEWRDQLVRACDQAIDQEAEAVERQMLAGGMPEPLR